MKIKPVILCGGAGTRLWPKSKKNLPKQFIDWGGWTLFGKTLERVKGSIFDYPVITTNSAYINLVKPNHSKLQANQGFIIQLDGKFQKIAIESHELLKLIAKDTKLNMADLASSLIWDSLQRNFPQTILHLENKGLVPYPEQLAVRAVPNEKGLPVFAQEFDQDLLTHLVLDHMPAEHC